ncbi:sulfite exporter TauE/SafE family protein [Nocardia sp. NPDC004722]
MAIGRLTWKEGPSHFYYRSMDRKHIHYDFEVDCLLTRFRQLHAFEGEYLIHQLDSGILLCGTIAVGASIQRSIGLGFALLATPILAALFGTFEGVSISNCAALAINLIGFSAAWRGVKPASMVPLIAAAVCTVPLGAWVAGRASDAWLSVGLGLLVSLATLLVIRGVRAPGLRGTGGAVTAGAASGFLNSTAGVSGPVVSLYAVNAGWTATELVSNFQLYGLVVNIVSLAAKGLPALTGSMWMLGAIGIAVGTGVGSLLSNRLNGDRVRRIVLVLALAGGLSMLGRGLLRVIGS